MTGNKYMVQKPTAFTPCNFSYTTQYNILNFDVAFYS